jgi:hypothetical protein
MNLEENRQFHWGLPAIVAVMFSVGCAGSVSEDQPTPVARFMYRPFASTYYGVTQGKVQQEFNGQLAASDFGMRFYVSTEVAVSNENLKSVLVLDSITQLAGLQGGIAQAQLDSARGATFSGLLSPDGTLHSFVGGDSAGSVARELADRFLSRFFPRIPADGAEPGLEWRDTVETNSRVSGADNSVLLFNHHQAVGWSLHHGERALQIKTQTNYTFHGSGVLVGQDFVLEGEGRRHSTHFLAADGRLLGSFAADTSEAKAHLTAAGIVIPVHQTRTDTLDIVHR